MTALPPPFFAIKTGPNGFHACNSPALSCRPWLIVVGRRPTLCKLPSTTVQHGRDVFLVSDSCSMLNHVKPQLCVLKSACQEACSTVRACPTSRFHALSASKLANSCIFHQKWFLEMCVGLFFFYLPELGELDRQDRVGGAAAKHELLCLALSGTDCNAGLLAALSWIIRTKIYCQRRRVEGGQRGLWGQNQSACFPN